MANNIDSLTNQSMQISGKTTQTSGTSSASPANAKAEGASSSAGQTMDTVQLTDDARLLQAAEQKLNQVSEVDSKRVEAVRSQIESGDYSVSAERTASKMMAYDRSLPDAK
ncbi:MAG: flagellar biosynthesis anti-sigma factor FlgM [Pseudomonadota bacterium]